MWIKSWLFCSFVTAALAVALAGCGQHGAGAVAGAQPSTSATMLGNLEITSWGPTSTKAGVVFNKQPDGAAALWVRLNQSLDGNAAAIEFNGTLLQGIISGNLVTAAVPAPLYAKPGVFTLHVIVRTGNKTMQSNDVKFTVD